MSNQHPVYLAFQGGGAKGISHIGGLAAVNDLELDIAGVAGTSAGAIVAALVAARCSSQSILDITADTHILQRVAQGSYADPTHLFTPEGWAKISFLLKTKKCVLKLVARFVNASTGSKACVIAVLLTLLIAGIAYFPRSVIGLACAFFLYVGIGLRTLLQGFAPLTAVRSVIDEAMATSLNIGKSNITFADLHASNGLPLKLVATNLTDRRLELFSFETTPDVVIADAVAASIRLPFIFKPWSIYFKRHDEAIPVQRWFLDGGLVSNLPVWCFDEERKLDQHAVTIGFGLSTLVEEAASDEHWMLSALTAVIDGPPQIHMRGIDRFIYIGLDCTLGVLDFDADLTCLKAEVYRAREKAILVLKQELTDVPGLMREALAQMEAAVWSEMCETYAGTLAGPECFPRVLLAIQRPGDRKSLTIAYDSDEASTSMQYTRLSLAHSTAGDAWQHRDEDMACFDLFLSGADEASEQHPRWTAVVPVPIFDPGPAELADAELAVVIVLASTQQAGIQLGASSNLHAFANDLHRLTSAFIKASDFGRLARRSLSWL